MIAGKTREMLEENLIAPTLIVKRRRNTVQKIKDNLLRKNRIMGGNIQPMINNPAKELPKADWRVLLLFAEQVYKETMYDDNFNVNPRSYFTDVEIRKARQYTGKLMIKDDISLPLTLDNVIQIDKDKYVTTISVKTLAELSALLLNYNFNIQREPTKRLVNGETIQEATLVMENVLEIKEHLIRDTLETTNIVINASAGTSYSGEELYYDAESMSLMISEGTVLDIVDGYHRCKASELAVNSYPDIDFRFMVLILNYTDDQAMKYQGQLAKATPLSRPRVRQLAEDRHADTIVKRLNTQSELRGKISLSSKPSLKNGELVSYDVLADAIDKHFDLERMVDVHLAGKFLVEFFDILIGYHEDEFINKPLKYKEETLLVENNMFIGYIILASRMFKEGVEPSRIIEIVDGIDFTRSKERWVELGITKPNKNLVETERLRKNISQVFETLEI